MQNGIKYEGKANKLIVITSEDNNDLSNCAYRILSKNIQVSIRIIIQIFITILNFVYVKLLWHIVVYVIYLDILNGLINFISNEYPRNQYFATISI